MSVGSAFLGIFASGIIASSATASMGEINKGWTLGDWPVTSLWREYSPGNWNNVVYMYENDTLNPVNKIELNPINKVDRIIDLFSCKVKECDLDDLSNVSYFELLNQIRKKEEYSAFLRTLYSESEYDLLEYIMVYLMQFNFSFITGEEEQLVIDCLKQNSQIQLQECALNAILEWDKVSDVNNLKNVKIKNSYLQESLNEFVEEHS